MVDYLVFAQFSEWFRLILPLDLPILEDIVESTRFFNPDEVHIALELAQENLNKGEDKSGYIFNIFYKIKVGCL